MDVGVVLCWSTSPQCDLCPLSVDCVWWGSGDDPAAGSAGVSARQARFEGSDRQARGRLMKALSVGSLRHRQLPDVMGCDAARAARLTAGLVEEGLVVTTTLTLRLP
jgi:A/G-specific adenine glycosylase